VNMAPGETKTVTFNITPEKLKFLNLDMKWVVEAGDFDVLTGSSSKDADLKKVVLTVK
jgi:beta-glucosidase